MGWVQGRGGTMAGRSGVETGGVLWEPSRSLRRTILVLLFASPACLLLFALAVMLWGPHRSAAFFVTFALALALSIALGWPMARKLRRQLLALEKQRDAFYQEILHLSKAAGLGEVASGIAHDLNNPLAIMREEAGWVQDLMESGESQKEHTRAEILSSLLQIHFQIERCLEITRRILHWGREQTTRFEATDVNQLVGKTLYLLETELQAADVQVVKAFRADLPPVACEAPELRQILLNLMKNALDAMRGRGGTMTLSTRFDRGRVIVTVSDTGPGIPGSDLGHIFEPFFTTKGDGEGTGLGLPISLWIARKLGGRIDVESAEGSGTSFHVTLPAAQPPDPQP